MTRPAQGPRSGGPAADVGDHAGRPLRAATSLARMASILRSRPMSAERCLAALQERSATGGQVNKADIYSRRSGGLVRWGRIYAVFNLSADVLKTVNVGGENYIRSDNIHVK